MQFDHPNFLIIRERQLAGTISTAAATSAYIGSSLKVRDKCVILGATVRVGSGGSAAGTQTLAIAKIDTGGTILSTYQKLSLTSSAGASAAGDVYDISMTTPFTVSSIGEAAAITGNAASLDKIVVLSDVIWRYRILPVGMPQNANIG